VLHHLTDLSKELDYVILPQITNSLRTSKHIDETIVYLSEKKIHAVIRVCEMEYSLLWSNTL